MGRVPWAAKDPIFWLHHSNIDRLWASWAQDSCRAKTTPTDDPTWKTRPFIFADENGVRVQAFAKDFEDLAKVQYVYDKLEPVVPLACVATPLPPTLMAARTLKLLTLSAGPAESFLAPLQSIQFPTLIRDLSPAKHVYLVLRDLHTDVEPGVVYYVYLELPPTLLRLKRRCTASALLIFLGLPATARSTPPCLRARTNSTALT